MEHIMENNKTAKTYSEILEPNVLDVTDDEPAEDYDYSYEDENYDELPLTSDDNDYCYDEYGGEEEDSYGSLESDYDEDDDLSYDDEDLSDNDILD